MLYHLMVGRRPLRHSKPILTSTYSFAVYEENEESKFEKQMVWAHTRESVDVDSL